MNLTELSSVIAAIAAISAAGGLIFNAMSYRKNTQRRNLQTLRDIASEIETLEDSNDRNSDLKTHYAVFARKHLNIHDRIAYLAQERVISKKLFCSKIQNIHK